MEKISHGAFQIRGNGALNSEDIDPMKNWNREGDGKDQSGLLALS
jgi:hypothetical protein